MHTDYTHPAPYSPPHDYMKDKKKVDKHVKEMTDENWHKGHLQHMGGAASMSNRLEEMHYGEGCKVKKHLRHVLEMLFFYSQTSHEIYKIFAEECFMKAKELCKHIEDEDDKEHAMHYLDMVRNYMADQGITTANMPMTKDRLNKKTGTNTVNL